MIRHLVKGLFHLLVAIAYRAYKAEGLNALFMVLPAKLLAPTLVKYGAQIGEHIQIHTPITFHNVSGIAHRHYANLQIGSDCYFGREVFLDLADKIIVGNNVTVSMRVMLLTHANAGASPLSAHELPPTHGPVVLADGCYIGAGAIILHGITVGEQAIIGAGAVVTHDVPPHTTVVGVPARVIPRKCDPDRAAREEHPLNNQVA
ncbi:MAG: acyltransferase [Anaerolineae bacterium]